MSENQSTPAQAGKVFNFSEVFWSKTSMLFGFYWLFRWIMPSLLPTSLRAADFQTQMIVCGIGGLVLTGLSALAQGTSAKPGAGQQ